jgi:hypothetical protein
MPARAGLAASRRLESFDLELEGARLQRAGRVREAGLAGAAPVEGHGRDGAMRTPSIGPPAA